jgi:hypothetical protein
MVMNLASNSMPSGYCPCALLCETFSPVWRACATQIVACKRNQQH